MRIVVNFRIDQVGKLVGATGNFAVQARGQRDFVAANSRLPRYRTLSDHVSVRSESRRMILSELLIRRLATQQRCFYLFTGNLHDMSVLPHDDRRFRWRSPLDDFPGRLLEGGFLRGLQPARFGGGEVTLLEFVDTGSDPGNKPRPLSESGYCS